MENERNVRGMKKKYKKLVNDRISKFIENPTADDFFSTYAYIEGVYDSGRMSLSRFLAYTHTMYDMVNVGDVE